jgi:hypothetical protein
MKPFNRYKVKRVTDFLIGLLNCFSLLFLRLFIFRIFIIGYNHF